VYPMTDGPAVDGLAVRAPVKLQTPTVVLCVELL